MSERIDQPEEAPKRGEAAWKEMRDDIAARNARAKKAGKLEREERERRAAEDRHARELRDRSSLAKLIK